LRGRAASLLRSRKARLPALCCGFCRPGPRFLMRPSPHGHRVQLPDRPGTGCEAVRECRALSQLQGDALINLATAAGLAVRMEVVKAA
jgi:hypothetical protein